MIAEFAFMEGYERFFAYQKGDCANTDNPYCTEDPRYQQFADGMQSAYEQHQVSIN